MTSSTILDLVAALSGVFQRLGIRWYLFGAQAAIVYGSTRLTADADVTVELGSRSIEDVVDGLQAAGFALRTADEDFVERTRVLPLVHTASEIAVDVVLAGPGLEELFLERARSVIFGSIEIPVVSPEDLLAMKLLAGRPHDLQDATAVIRANADTIDLNTVRSTLGLLEKALDRSDLLPALEQLLRRAIRSG